MKTPETSLTAVVLSLLAPILGGLLLVAPPAYAQTAVSTSTSQASGTVGPGAAVGPGTALGFRAPEAPADENVSCSGPVNVTTTAVSDPTLPPGVVVSIDARGLSCVGQTTGTVYVNSGQANLTRLLVPSDVIETTFAFYPNTAGGFLQARIALLTLNLSYDTTTGALTGATASIGNF